MNALIGFAVERGKSLVSKKVGAAVLTAGAATGGAPTEAVWTGIAYIFAQALVDCFTIWNASNED